MIRQWALFFICSFYLVSLDAAPVYKAKDFSYLLGKTPGIDASVLSLHFTLYQGYVKNTNQLNQMVEKLRANKEDRSLSYGALVRRLAWEMNGMILHELYFENLGGQSTLSSRDPLYKEIEESFGSFEMWKQNFLATGMIRGIGWVILYRDREEGNLYTIWVDDHNINLLAGGTPLLVMDVWEHAYLTQYGINRASYLDAFFRNIRWDVVKKRSMERKEGFGRKERGVYPTR